MIYPEALKIAQKIYKKLHPFCTQIDIAGSVRREKPEVKDIEICCVPRKTEMKDLFQNVIGTQRLAGFVSEVSNMGIILKGDVRTGRYVQIKLPEGINLDLFIPMEEAYWLQLVIRTGAADYSHKVIANAWLKKGYCGTENGLRLMTECYKKDLGSGKHKWICNVKNPTLPPSWDSEYSLYKWLNLQWIEPKNRYV